MGTFQEGGFEYSGALPSCWSQTRSRRTHAITFSGYFSTAQADARGFRLTAGEHCVPGLSAGGVGSGRREGSEARSPDHTVFAVMVQSLATRLSDHAQPLYPLHAPFGPKLSTMNVQGYRGHTCAAEDPPVSVFSAQYSVHSPLRRIKLARTKRRTSATLTCRLLPRTPCLRL